MRLATDLKDRVLRYDGVSTISPEMVADALLRGAKPTEIRITDTNWEMAQFNANCDEGDELLPDTDEVKIDKSWNLPLAWAALTDADVEQIILEKATDVISTAGYSEQKVSEAYLRVEKELDEIKKRDMFQFVKAIMYVLETFSKNNICWGVGRGSSCASYILFILGLHVVDCVKFDVCMQEFFHD